MRLPPHLYFVTALPSTSVQLCVRNVLELLGAFHAIVAAGTTLVTVGVRDRYQHNRILNNHVIPKLALHSAVCRSDHTTFGNQMILY